MSKILITKYQAELANEMRAALKRIAQTSPNPLDIVKAADDVKKAIEALSDAYDDLRVEAAKALLYTKDIKID